MEPTASRSANDLDVVQAPAASVTLFGHDSEPARLELRARGRAWRLRRALVPLAATLVVTPAVTLIPPHAPWAAASLGIGGLLAWRRWSEAYTVVDFEARCPRCGTDLAIPAGSRLRFPHPLSCPDCGHEPVLQVDRTVLEAASDEGAEDPGSP